MLHSPQNVTLTSEIEENRQNQLYPGVSGYESGTAARQFRARVLQFSFMVLGLRPKTGTHCVLNNVSGLIVRGPVFQGRFGVLQNLGMDENQSGQGRSRIADIEDTNSFIPPCPPPRPGQGGHKNVGCGGHYLNKETFCALGVLVERTHIWSPQGHKIIRSNKSLRPTKIKNTIPVPT